MQLTLHQKDLIRRYLIWCYKTTKEEFDRIERYFTQLKVDRHVLAKLRAGKDYKKTPRSDAFRKLIDQFEEYMSKKERHVLEKKYLDPQHTDVSPQYLYLKHRLLAVESAIVRFLGKKEKDRIRKLYEVEMTERILKAKDNT